MGRDFLKRFKSTEFDWENSRVRLGESWLSTEASFWGGQVLSRAGAVNRILSKTKELTQGGRWNINLELTALQRSVMESLLDEFPMSWPRTPRGQRKLTRWNTVSSLVKARCTRVSPWAEQEINTQIKQMLENSFIRPSISPWASKVILVEKKDGSIRFAVNYRWFKRSNKERLVSHTRNERYFGQLLGSEYFSTLYGASAYWCVPILGRRIKKRSHLSRPGVNSNFASCPLACAMHHRPTRG